MTEVDAASVAAASASLQPQPRTLAATKTPQKTSPAPTVSTAVTLGAAMRNASSAEKKAAPSAPKRERDGAGALHAERLRRLLRVAVGKFARLAAVDDDKIDERPVVVVSAVGRAMD